MLTTLAWLINSHDKTISCFFLPFSCFRQNRHRLSVYNVRSLMTTATAATSHSFMFCLIPFRSQCVEVKWVLHDWNATQQQINQCVAHVCHLFGLKFDSVFVVSSVWRVCCVCIQTFLQINNNICVAYGHRLMHRHYAVYQCSIYR